MSMHRCKGLTLLELLTALSVATLLTVLSISGLQLLSESTSRTTAIYKILTTLDRARSLAVIRGKRVSVCSLDADNLCLPNWSSPKLAVFIDSDKDSFLDSNEELVYAEEWDNNRARISWNNWLRAATITYEPNGSVVSNGTIKLTDNHDNLFKSIVISKPGRARLF